MNARLRLFVPLVLTLGLGALLWLGLGNNPYSQDEAVAGRTLPAWQSDNLLGGAPIHTAALKGSPSCSTSGPAGAPTAAPNIRCWVIWPTPCPSMASTTETRGRRPRLAHAGG